MNNIIYADHCATTKMKDEVLKEMLPFLSNDYGNASSLYSIGRKAKETIDSCKQKIAKILNCKPTELYFTSGGSESDNMILKGIARKNKAKGKHIITTKIEHLAILNTCKELETEGFEITYLNVDNTGMINLNELKNNIRADTILISVMFANNEIGTIEPIEEISQIAKENNIYFHTDAVQAIGNIEIDVQKLNIDALSLSAHKFYGPKGIGLAYIKENINFIPLICGGHQEFGMRAGTENIASIVGLTKALELATINIEEYNKKLLYLREILLTNIFENIHYVKLNGPRDNRLPGNINISFLGVDAASLLLMLDMKGICVSTGSACNSESRRTFTCINCYWA